MAHCTGKGESSQRREGKESCQIIQGVREAKSQEQSESLRENKTGKVLLKIESLKKAQASQKN